MMHFPIATKSYLKVITVNVRDFSHMEEHHSPINEIRQVKSYMKKSKDEFEICELYIMHPELLTAEDKIALDSYFIKY